MDADAATIANSRRETDLIITSPQFTNRLSLFPYGHASLRRQRQACVGIVLRREVVEGRLADIHHHLDDLPGKGKWRQVLIGHRRAGVAANVEALVCRVEAADLFLEPPRTDRLLAESKCDRAARFELAWLVGLH